MSPAKGKTTTKRAVAKKTTARRTTRATFTAEERAAMKERTREIAAEKRRGAAKRKGDGERDLLAKIAEMPPSDRALAERVHALVTANAPGLSPRTWYGMPAYAQDDKVVCFLQVASRFKTRYATFGFTDKAHLDDGAMWGTGFAIVELTAAAEARIVALVKKAAS